MYERPLGKIHCTTFYGTFTGFPCRFVTNTFIYYVYLKMCLTRTFQKKYK